MLSLQVVVPILNSYSGFVAAQGLRTSNWARCSLVVRSHYIRDRL